MSAYSIGLAEARYKAVAKALTGEVARTYPAGCNVTVTMGRTTFDAKVVKHGWCTAPDRITGRDLKTGKLRHFYPGNIKRRITDKEMVDALKVMFR